MLKILWLCYFVDTGHSVECS